MPAASDAAKLVETRRHDPAIVPQLEAFVEQGTSYDLDVHLALLKLYQFNPELFKAPVVAKVFVKALTRLPETDYLTCTYLVPERLLDEEPLSNVTAVASLLESCKFREVWEKLKPLRDGGLLAAVPGFEEAMRKYILRTFQIVYQTVPTAHVRESLGVESDDALAKLVKPLGWTVDGQLVKIALNDDNMAKPKRQELSEHMSLAQMAKILASVATAAHP